MGYKGFHHTEEWSINHSKAMKGKHYSPRTEFKKGHPSPKYWSGKKQPKEVIEKRNKSLNTFYINSGKERGFRKGHIPHNKGKKGYVSHRNGLTMEQEYGIEKAKEISMKQSLVKIGKHIGHKGYFTGGKHTEEWKRRRSIEQKEAWQNLEFKEKRIKVMLKGMFKRPTTLEQDFINFIEAYKLPFNYVGNGKLIIDGKNPDFVENNGRKLVIEVRHTKVCLYKNECSPEEYRQKRIEHFAKNGWKCLVLFENDFKDEHILLEKVNQFLK